MTSIVRALLLLLSFALTACMAHDAHHGEPGDVPEFAHESVTPDRNEHKEHAIHMEHESHAEKGAHSGHQMHAEKGAHSGHQMHEGDAAKHEMPSAFGGRYKNMNSLGSGTSLLPADSPMEMWGVSMFGENIWVHGQARFGVYSTLGPRGVTRMGSENWAMAMWERNGWTVRAMATLEPFTAPECAFPQLFQTGETCGGKFIVDGQHAHKPVIMELAAGKSWQLDDVTSAFVYGGIVCEPALGPGAFMHRWSGQFLPAPLSHHGQDSTHITTPCLTLGLDWQEFRLELSTFHGQEPGESAFAIKPGRFDSFSGRISWVPNRNWVVQFSSGLVHNPHRTEPGDTIVTTGSASFNQPTKDGYVAATVVVGHTRESHGNANSFLLESTWNFDTRNYLYGRFERVDKEGLTASNIFGAPGAVRDDESHDAEHHELDLSVPQSLSAHDGGSFSVSALSVGYLRNVYETSDIQIGLGATVTLNFVPSGLQEIYGGAVAPAGMAFISVRPGKHR